MLAKRTPAFVVAAVLLLAGHPARAVDLGDGIVHLRHEAFPVQVGPSRAPSPALLAGARTWIVAFDGPADRIVRDEIAGAGGRIVGFVPSRAYLVRADADDARRLAALPAIRRVDAYPDEWKASPDLDRARLAGLADPRLFAEVWEGEDPRRAAEGVRAAGAEVLRIDDAPGLHRLLVRAGPDRIDAICAVSEVQWVEEIPRPTLRNDTVRWIIQSNDGVGLAVPLHDHGLFGAGEILGHIDDPPYLPSCYFVDSLVAEPGPTHRKVVALRRVTGPTSGAHGTHTAGTAAGENADPASPQWRGMAPKARLSHSSYYDLDGEYNGQPSNLFSFLAAAHADGARIHTNSYGDDARTSYTSWCVDIDTFARMNEEDLVVFASTNLPTLKTPENAKNCLATGASYSAPDQALHAKGGVGPTPDGRRKPEVYAPGRNTRSAATASPCATSLNTGTSMSAPAVAGGAALAREYFRRGFHPTGTPWPRNARVPTGALLKAVVINSTVDMAGVAGYPSNLEGWGRILLDDALYFAGDDRRLWLRDVRHAEGLSTGDVDAWSIRVVDPSQPLAVTMAFMDQPAVLNAAYAPVNDLDLEVEGPTGLYRGNVFDVLAGESVTDGSPDALNNVERVVVTAPATGEWSIRVRGASIPAGPQGFAVVANGGLAGPDRRDLPAPDLDHPEPPEGRARGADLALYVASPNPFRGSTTLRFTVPETMPVTLRVHDVSGRLVRELLARPVEAGQHRLTWDGLDERGRRASPGVYFIRLTAPGADRLVKTALLR
jgi:hypothetical protein